MKNVSVLGSTGSIGRSALDVVEAFPDRFRVVALAAGRSVERLAEQVKCHRPELVAVAGKEEAGRLKALLPAGLPVRIATGNAGLDEVAVHEEADVVVGGLVGALGLRSAHAAVSAGKRLAMANKEPLVVAGDLILEAARKSGAEIIPVDSEHSAIHQAMRCGRQEEVGWLVLTASGGPFRERDLATFESITVEDALAHPTWKMGPKITIDSATMMNKGLEIIEAHWLFGVKPEQVRVVIHPQSTIHSMVEFEDGSLLAQLGVTDMRLPIQYALTYPERVSTDLPSLDLDAPLSLDFHPPDFERFPCLRLAYLALEMGGTAPAVLNAANEMAVAAFLEERIGFLTIPEVLAETLSRHRVRPSADLETILEADRLAREQAERIIHMHRASAAIG